MTWNETDHPRRPAGLARGVAGAFRPAGGMGDDADLMDAEWTPDPRLIAGERLRGRIETAAAQGHAEEAMALARDAGCITPSDPMPDAGEGAAAYFDGERLSTILFHDGGVEQADWFDARLLDVGDA